jgi:hypothetical protein
VFDPKLNAPRKFVGPTLSTLLTTAWQARISFVGQGFSFLAMILPPFFALFGELSFLVVVSSFAMLIAYIGTWSISNIFPALAEPEEAAVALTSSAFTLVCFFFCAMLVLLVWPLSAKTESIVFWSSVMGLAQGCYILMIAVAVRDQDYHVIASARFILGIVSFVATLMACISPRFETSLVLVAIISMAVASFTVGWKKRNLWIAALRTGLRHSVGDWANYLFQYSSVTVGTFAALSAFNITNIGIVGLGQFSDAWSVVARIGGGFGTTAQYILAPLYEIRFSRSVRERDAAAAQDAQRHGLIAGIALGLLSAALILVILWVTGAMHSISRGETTTVSLSGSIYVIALLSTSVIAKNASLAGGKRSYLAWAAFKACAGVLAVSFLASTSLLVTLVVIETIFQIFYVVLARVHVAALQSQSRIQMSPGVGQLD